MFTEFPELAPAGVELPEHIPVKAGQGEEPEKDGQKADKRMNSPKNSMKEECMATGANGTPKKNCTEGNDVYPGHHTSTRILEVRHFGLFGNDNIIWNTVKMLSVIIIL